MNTKTKDVFDDFEADDFEADIDAGRVDTKTKAARVSSDPNMGWHEEKCQDCNGSGDFISYAGRYVGPCFKCKGKGIRRFKTSADARAKARKSAQARKENKAQDNWDAFAKANPERAEWIQANPKFEFAIAMGQNARKFGSLTDNMLAGIDKCIARRKAKQADNKPAPQVSSQVWDALVRSGKSGAKLWLGDFAFALAKKHSKNPGAIYVTKGERYLGKVVNGEFLKQRECTQEQVDQIVATMDCDDLEAEVIKHGKLTMHCACCGLELTAEESKQRGIGPICAAKWGFI